MAGRPRDPSGRFISPGPTPGPTDLTDQQEEDDVGFTLFPETNIPVSETRTDNPGSGSRQISPPRVVVPPAAIPHRSGSPASVVSHSSKGSNEDIISDLWSAQIDLTDKVSNISKELDAHR